MTNQEHEIMIIAAEECAEVIQAISKCIRFGFEDEYAGACTNVSRLAEEVGDLLCMFDLMVERGIIKQSAVYDASIDKRAFQADISKIYAALAEGQQDFGSEFTAIWDANLDALYEA